MDESAVVCASDDSGAPAVCVFHFHADDARYGETDKTREQGRIVYYFVGWEIKMHKINRTLTKEYYYADTKSRF